MVEYVADTREPVLLGEILQHVLIAATARSRRPTRPERAPARTHNGGVTPETGDHAAAEQVAVSAWKWPEPPRTAQP
ncbi:MULTISPECIES: hypothetical protein [unclassified Streptomyces]|uniref:hypothetical protein n=1 Tax=unclassified Streptomyces TaxID=2593676 RepID=UPI002E134BE7|nr:hypothetical protein OG452_16595 [Streptomyces sp. NBC_01197]WSS50519.1 hypothetical protein OG708_18930 [Streptomyces sp. NBC_01180]